MRRKVNSFLNKKIKTPIELDLICIFRVALLQIFIAVLRILEIEISRQLLETLFTRRTDKLLMGCCCFVFIYAFFSIINRTLERYTMTVRGTIIISLTKHILKKNANLQFITSEDMNENDKLSIADGDCERYADGLLGMTALFSSIIVIPCYIIYGFTINVYITLLIIIVSFCMSLMNKNNKMKLCESNEERNDSYGYWANYLWKALDNLEVIKIFLSKDKIIKEQRLRNNTLCKAEQKTLKTYLDVCLIEESSDMLFTMLILCSSFLAILNHKMPATSILAMVEALNAVQKNIFQLPEQIIHLKELESIASRIYKLEKMEEDNATEELEEDFFNLTVDNIYFNYQDDRILNGIHYEFQKGKFYVVVGPSGCGKTTFLKVLARLLPVSEGKVYWNEKNISKLTRDSIYKRMSYTSQNKVFLEDTIRNNICLDKTDSQVYKQVLKKSFFERVFEKNNNNDELVLALNGWPLSSGECQMVSFANILYTQKQLILLDEAFSAIDPAKEKSFYKCIKELTEKGATVILVSHRLTNIDMSDCILFMENGYIKESGTFDELYRRKGDFYFWYNMNKEANAE